MRLLCLFHVLLTVGLIHGATTNRSFEISPDGTTFLRDGQKIQLVSGSIHYFRSLPEQWNDRLSAARAAGLNAIQFYIPWNFHSPAKNVYDFTSYGRDLGQYLDLAQKNGLMVLLRMGPYICGEWDFGGFPWYMIKQYPDGLPIRTSNASYMALVKDWWGSLLPYLRRYTYNGNGGPIVMLQIENEYGSYGSDHTYLEQLRDFARNIFDDGTLFYSTDGGATYYTSKTAISGVFQVVDFGPGADLNSSFAAQHQYNYVKGPDMNAEYYPGWLTHWGDSQMATSATPAILTTLEQMLQRGASVNFYMFHGGSNNEYWNGANGGPESVQFTVQSYDYDAPLTEAGDPTAKYFAIRSLIGKYVPLPNVPVPTMQPKAKYGPVQLTQSVLVLEVNATACDSGLEGITTYASMESVGQPFGFVTYRTTISAAVSAGTLEFTHPRDYHMVFVNGKKVGTALRGYNTSVPGITVQSGDILTVLVENMGRINYGAYTYDPKGMINPWTLAGKPLPSAWSAVGCDFTNVSSRATWGPRAPGGVQAPVFLKGTFPVSSQEALRDTFLDMRGWGKGSVWVNDFNVGRYWGIGPQYSLYVAKQHLKVGDNTIIILDLLGDPGLQAVFDSVPHDKRPDDPYTPAPTAI